MSSLGSLPSLGRPRGGLASLGSLPSLSGGSSLGALKRPPLGKLSAPVGSSSKEAVATTEKTSSKDGKRIKALKLALKHDPPTIALVYQDVKAGKKRVHSFPVDLRGGSATSVTVAAALQQEHPSYLAEGTVPAKQLQKLVQMLCDKLKGDMQKAAKQTKAPSPKASSPKAASPKGSPKGKVPSPKGKAPPKSASPKGSGSEAQTKKYDLDLDGLDLSVSEDDFVVSDDDASEEDVMAALYGNPDDFNDLSAQELAEKKKEMDVAFMKNRLKPGDPGYVHNKEVEFTPAEEPSDWD